MRSPILAAILSLIVAGLGQIYNGQIGKGVIFISLQLINGGLTAVLIGWILLPIVGLYLLKLWYVDRMTFYYEQYRKQEKRVETQATTSPTPCN